ncbi:MAG: GYD domain-containing protein [Anaerolineae bacterium]|nr:GYD domain-containing protein [Anaerolineae bacterium]NIN99382.1 GYD domain-containing protein [Anaerolineae bacterium]NIQ82247.1 GYD domain-containing protein [Anaerolineae bacterium]
MPTFILLSKISSGGATQVKSLVETDKEFEAELERQCPGVKRVASYALLGAYDFLHIFEAADAREAAKVALLASSFGAASTQTLTAIPFSEFQEIVEEL